MQGTTTVPALRLDDLILKVSTAHRNLVLVVDVVLGAIQPTLEEQLDDEVADLLASALVELHAAIRLLENERPASPTLGGAA
jgi:hypothetical protein